MRGAEYKKNGRDEKYRILVGKSEAKKQLRDIAVNCKIVYVSNVFICASWLDYGT